MKNFTNQFKKAYIFFTAPIKRENNNGFPTFFINAVAGRTIYPNGYGWINILGLTTCKTQANKYYAEPYRIRTDRERNRHGVEL